MHEVRYVWQHDGVFVIEQFIIEEMGRPLERAPFFQPHESLVLQKAVVQSDIDDENQDVND